MDASDDSRDEELASISAIYPELETDPANPYHATLDLDVVPITPLKVRFYKATHHDDVALDSEDPHAHTLTYLPPLHLSLELPLGYPDERPPLVVVSSMHNWLSQPTITHLELKMKELWEEYGHTAVIYAFIDFLQTEAEQAFGLLERRSDGTALLNTRFKESLLGYDKQKTKEVFNKGNYPCGVCLDTKPGTDCYKLQMCNHIFCVACLQDFYNSAITEGSVGEVKCLDPDCGFEGLNAEQRREKKRKTLHPRELLDIPLERPQVERYVKMKLKKKIESDKNTIYCPRSWCQAPAQSAKYAKFNFDKLEEYPDDSDDEGEEAEEQQELSASSVSGARIKADRLSICSACKYAFCRRCQRTWHGEYFACRFNTANPDLLSEDEIASNNWLRMHTTPCPTCAAPCQKTHGCNHMKCPECETHFCYLCSAWLEPRNPYKHFNSKGSTCHERLWDLQRGDEADADQQVAFGGARGYEIEHILQEQADVIVPADAGEPIQVARAIISAPAVQPNQNGHRQYEANRGLQRFLQMAANDDEDEWDSDGLEEDIQHQLHLLEPVRV